MFKRFTDCDKWEDPWYRKLPIKYKVFWGYITNKCDNAGVWKEDMELAEFQIGEPVDKTEALKLFNSDKDRVEILPKNKWHIKEFVKFQYGELGDLSNPHKQVRSLLKDHGLLPNVGYMKPSGRLQDKDKEQEQDQDKDKDNKAQFEKIWLQYPNRVGKKAAFRHFLASVKTENDLLACQAALEKYSQHLAVNTWKVPQNGSTWFNNWRDWEDWVEPERRETDEERDARLIKQIGSK